ncbi:TPA: hypothetical protein PGA45_003100 [Staphylococcus aureus]|uniref:Phage protein n=1 Tax=Staphylococcus aureus TaxID=1280 RepID=A0A9N8FB81_STAAU|nr:hypothetical protein [Staphylococcus aureus]CAC5438021.1 phage protein [Staphylococcus aureus]CAC5482420.1 phage protein [Staphylococcus aureus]CAC5807203.1 phage protein [Staphylococcus aureus]CAC5807474.1 phage protein [Staphylococcus aureus]CAC5808064.1 phage protein [Staphylococcus aureus]
MDKLLGRRIQLENEVDQLQEKHEKLLKEAKEFKFKAEVLDKIIEVYKNSDLYSNEDVMMFIEDRITELEENNKE